MSARHMTKGEMVEMSKRTCLASFLRWCSDGKKKTTIEREWDATIFVPTTTVGDDARSCSTSFTVLCVPVTHFFAVLLPPGRIEPENKCPFGVHNKT